MCFFLGGYSGYFDQEHGVNVAVVRQIGLLSLILDTWMTPHEQQGDMLCFLSVVALLSSFWHQMKFFPLVKERLCGSKKCHHGLHGQHSGE